MNMKKNLSDPLTAADKNCKRLWVIIRANAPFSLYGSLIQKKWNLPLAWCTIDNGVEKTNCFLQDLYSQNATFEKSKEKEKIFKMLLQTNDFLYPSWIKQKLMKYMQYSMPGQRFHLEVERLRERCGFGADWHYYLIFYLVTGLMNVPLKVDTPDLIPTESREELTENSRIYWYSKKKEHQREFIKSYFGEYPTQLPYKKAFYDFVKRHPEFSNLVDGDLFGNSDIAYKIWPDIFDKMDEDSNLSDENFSKLNKKLIDKLKKRYERFNERYYVPIDPKIDKDAIEELEQLLSQNA